MSLVMTRPVGDWHFLRDGVKMIEVRLTGNVVKMIENVLVSLSENVVVDRTQMTERIESGPLDWTPIRIDVDSLVG